MTKLSVFLVVIMLAVSASSCRPPKPGEPSLSSKFIDCTKQELREQSLAVLDDVTGVLTSADIGNPGAWLDIAKPAFVDIAKRAGLSALDAVLCAVGFRQQTFAAGASSNPDDKVSMVGASRASTVLADYGVELKLK